MLYQAEEVKPRVAGSIHGRHGSEVLPVRATSAEKSTTWWPQKLQRLHLNFLLFIKIGSSQQPSAGKTLGRGRSHPDERDKAKDKEEEMSGQGVLRDEAGEPRKLLMGESSHSDSKSTLKDYWRTFGMQETPKWHRQPSFHTHTSDFLFSDIPLIKGSCSCLTLLCCVWMFWGKSILPAFPPAGAITKLFIILCNYRELEEWRFPPLRLHSCALCALGAPLPWGETQVGPTFPGRERWLLPLHPPSPPSICQGLRLCVQSDRCTDHQAIQMKTSCLNHLNPRPTRRHYRTPTGSLWNAEELSHRIKWSWNWAGLWQYSCKHRHNEESFRLAESKCVLSGCFQGSY